MLRTKIKNSLDGIKQVLKNKVYLAIFIASALVFSLIYIFAWNFILLSNLYVRIDLWTPLNLFFLVTISVLSGLILSLNVYSLRSNLSFYKKTRGYFAIIPALFTSVCPTCAPLLLSFSSATIGIGMLISGFNIFVNVFIILLLGLILMNISSNLNNCKIKAKK